MADAKTTTDVEKLNAQIAELKTDMQTITKTLAEIGAQRRDSAAESVRGAAEDLRHRSEKQMFEAQLAAEKYGKQATDAVREQPAMAMGLAVGLGFLVGFATGRK